MGLASTEGLGVCARGVSMSESLKFRKTFKEHIYQGLPAIQCLPDADKESTQVARRWRHIKARDPGSSVVQHNRQFFIAWSP